MTEMSFHIYNPPFEEIKSAKNAKIITIDGENCREISQFYKILTTELILGVDFGNNLDALYDSLADLSWIPASTILLNIIHSEEWLVEESKEDIFNILEVLNDAAMSFSDVMYGAEERALSFYFDQSNRIESILDDSFLIWGHVG